MRKRRLFFLLGMIVLLCGVFAISGECKNYTGRYDKPYKKETTCKVAKDEVLETWDDMACVYRSSFGLVAKNVKNYYVNLHSSDLYFTQFNKPNRLLEVDFLRRKKKGKALNYVCYKVVDKAKEVYLIDDIDMFFRNLKGKICFTGAFPCNLFFEHKTEKECEASQRKNIRNKVVLSDVKKCWSGADMFAYIKDNTLYITGYALQLRANNNLSCYERESVTKSFFEGKGNQIKQVVADITDKGYVILVLMKDGSVWGLGDNTNYLLTAKDDKYYEDDFIQIVESGVKKVEIATENIGILKKNNTLWIWGKGYNKGKKKYSRKPQKVASNVKQFSVATKNIYFVNKKATAYGMGSNECYQLSNKYDKSWKAKPVKLMENVKQVHGIVGNGYSTCLLTKKNELYWAGEQTFPSLYWW